MAAQPQGVPHTRKDIEEAVHAAVAKTGNWLSLQFTAEISAVKWEYPTPPMVRDIVDTGRLRASQTRIDSGDSVSFNWPVEYAQQVHEGGVALNGMPFPPRPWTRRPLKEMPVKFGQILAEELRQRFG